MLFLSALNLPSSAKGLNEPKNALYVLYCVVFFPRVTEDLMDSKVPKETRERKGTE